MTRFIPAIAAALLATAAATPAFAQPAIQEPGAFAFYHPNLDVLGGRPAYQAPRAYQAPLDANALYNEAVPAPRVRHRAVVPRQHRAMR